MSLLTGVPFEVAACARKFFFFTFPSTDEIGRVEIDLWDFLQEDPRECSSSDLVEALRQWGRRPQEALVSHGCGSWTGCFLLIPPHVWPCACPFSLRSSNFGYLWLLSMQPFLAQRLPGLQLELPLALTLPLSVPFLALVWNRLNSCLCLLWHGGHCSTLVPFLMSFSSLKWFLNLWLECLRKTP